MTLIHVLAGLIALLSGFISLYAPKGRPWHRTAGTVFVCSMLIMCAAGLTMSVWRHVSPEINIPASLLTAALVASAWTTVAPLRRGQRALDLVDFSLFAAIAPFCLALGVVEARHPGGFPAFPYVMFGTVALLAAIGDWRVLRGRPRQGAARLGRHLWRMTYALLIACMSFFLGQADEFPERLRILPLLATPVVAVLLTMLYWLWRMRGRRAAIA